MADNQQAPYSHEQFLEWEQALLRRRAGHADLPPESPPDGLWDRLVAWFGSLRQHPAEREMRRFELDLIRRQREHLREIDAALQRLSDGTFGICTVSGHVIAAARLDQMPWTPHTVEVAQRLEAADDSTDE